MIAIALNVVRRFIKKTDIFRIKGGDLMIKQMDEMVSGLGATRRRARRIARYWIGVTAKIVIAVTLPVWLIPYRIYRRRHG